GDVMGGGLPLDGSIDGQDDLVELTCPFEQIVAGDVVGADAVEGGEDAAEDVVADGANTGAFQRPEVGHVFNHDQHAAFGAAGIGADGAGAGSIDITADFAGPDGTYGPVEGGRQRDH